MSAQKQKVFLVVQLSAVIVILIIANAILGFFPKRIDLTSDHRNTPTETAKQVLDSLEAPVLIKCYLYGDMPPKYQEMRDQVETFFYELKFVAGDNLEYEFIDPTGNTDLFDQFVASGHYPFKVVEGGATEQNEKYILPYATVTYRKREEVVNMIRGSVYRDPQSGALEIATEKVIQDLEYNLMTVIFNLTRKQNKFVGVLTGHGEYGPEECGDLYNDLDDYYKLLEIDISKGEAITPSCEVLLVMGPDSTFTEREKYELDQYMMRGGRIFWMLDHEAINFDIGAQERTMTQLRQLNLDDMFMKWGFRVNYDIVQDQRCDRIPVALPNPSFGSQIQNVPWIFHPQVGMFPPHPVCRNLDLVLMRFPASIDTISRPGISYEPFLYSSQFTRTVQGNQYIDVDAYVREPVPENLFNKGPQVMGMVVKGKFPSVFRGREAPVDSAAPNPPTAQFLPYNVDTTRPKMVVISDGEFATGSLYQGKIGRLPYDNKSLVMNCVDYLSGDEVLSSVRSQAVATRPLDPDKIESGNIGVILVNMVLPLLLLLIFGVAWTLGRRASNKAGKK